MDRQETQMGDAPRITQEAIEANIVSEHYFTAYEGVLGERFHHRTGENDANSNAIPRTLRLLTICVVILRNGYTVHGVSACASPENYNQTIGEQIARENAIDQIWPLMGYELRTRLHRLRAASDAELGEALTRMTAYRLGNKGSFRPEDAEIILDHFTNKGEDTGEEGGKTYADTRTE